MANEPEKMNDVNEGAPQAQEKPKKKKPIMIFRPQNSKTGMVKSGQRPGTVRKAPPRKPAAPRPAPGKGADSADTAAKKSTTATSADTTAAAVSSEKIAKGQTSAAASEAVESKVSTAVSEAAGKASAEAKNTLQAETTATAASSAASSASADTMTAGSEQRKTATAPEQESKEETPAKSAFTGVFLTSTPSSPRGKTAPSGEGRQGRAKSEDTNARAAKDSDPGTGRTGQKTGSASGKAGARDGGRDSAQAGSGRSTSRDGKDGSSRDGGSRDGARGVRGGERSGSAGTRGGAGAGRNGAPGRGEGRGEGRTDGRTEGRDGKGRGFAGGASTGGRGGAGGGRGGAGEKSFDKDGRKGDRGSKRGGRAEKGDKFDRMEQRSGQGKSQGGRPKPGAKTVKPATKPVVKEEKIKSIILPETLTIKELAEKLKIQGAAIVKKLFLQGQMVTVNEEISYETAEEIALDYDVLCEKEVKIDVLEELLKDTEDPAESLVARPPVVCVMGHVDHGKTSLLDAIRNTHVIDREAGGITQHIGASVVTCNGQKITFLDTPGHEAFTAMRMRGANSTDIAILVVAADDGVMPQTVEAINHAKAAGIEIIVAINKIDKPAANVEKVKQELTEYELIPEDWGGSTIFVPVSAKTHEGIDTLLEMVLLTAEVLELKANPNRKARGLVIEARLDKGRGPVATILVQKGTLHVGDPVAAGSCYGKVRAMLDSKGRSVKEAGPSMPVEIQGFSDVPGAGEIVVGLDSEKEARSFAETFISEGREKLLEETKQKMSLDDLFSQIQAGNLKELLLIVKADVQGSVEAVKQSLLKLSNDEVVVKIIHSGAGAINESDVILASASNAIIIGFNVRPDPQAKNTAEQEGVDIRLYSVIYDAIADVEAAMKGMLDPIFEEKVIGHAQIRQTFRASGVGTIAGCYVLDGVFTRGCSARITRDGTQIFDGLVASLKRFKDDVKEVRAGYECGLVFEKFNDLKEDDLIEAYTMVEVPR